MKPAIAIPAIAALVYRAWSRKSLTPVGILTAFLTAVAHAVHPWSVFFALLTVFFLAGTAVTKVKHNVKATLTQSATGASGGEGPRNHIQVLANSLIASVLILLHTWQLHKEGTYWNEDLCWKSGGDVIVIGIVANYAAVAADTFSSELGILSTSKPRLITAPWRIVPPGTNGGVTMAGLIAGWAGASLIAGTSVLLLPFCKTWSPADKAIFTYAISAAGFAGTLLDSLLGALFQASVVDVHSGKIVEGAGGRKVMIHSTIPHSKLTAEAEGGKSSGVETSANAQATRQVQKAAVSGSEVAEGHHESRKVEAGHDILDNNAVNIAMAGIVSVGSMAVAAWAWDVPLSSIVSI